MSCGRSGVTAETGNAPDYGRQGQHAYCLLVAQLVGRWERPARVDGGGASTTARERTATRSGPRG